MAQDTLVTGSKLTAIANAIRTRGGTQAQLTLDQMPQAVADIPGGGGGFDWSQWTGGIQFKPEARGSYYPTTPLDLTGIDTSSFTSMEAMFQGLTGIPSIDTSTMDTSNVANMSAMFQRCSALRSLDLYTFNTSNVTTFYSMFYGCASLKSVNLASIDTASKSAMTGYMFNSDANLEAVIWATRSQTVQPLSATPNQYFLPTNAPTVFYVPDALVEDYKTATNWSTIATRIKGISELPATYQSLYAGHY